MAERETELREHAQERCDILTSLVSALPGVTPGAFSVLAGNMLGSDATLDGAGNLTVTAEDGSGTATIDGSGLAAVIDGINDAARREPADRLRSLIDRISSGDTEGVRITNFVGLDDHGRASRGSFVQLSISDGNGTSALLLEPGATEKYPSGDGRNVGAVARFTQIDPAHPTSLVAGADVVPFTNACYHNLDTEQRTQRLAGVVDCDDGRQLFFVAGQLVLAPNEPTFYTTENFVTLCAEHPTAVQEIAVDGGTYKSPEDFFAKIEELESAERNPEGSIDLDAMDAEHGVEAGQDDGEVDMVPLHIGMDGILNAAIEEVQKSYPERSGNGVDSDNDPDGLTGTDKKDDGQADIGKGDDGLADMDEGYDNPVD